MGLPIPNIDLGGTVATIDETSGKWYRKYWRPWGTVIGYHDVAWVSIDGGTVEIHRHFKTDGKVKHYIGVGAYADRFLFKTLKACLQAAQERFAGLQPMRTFGKGGSVVSELGLTPADARPVKDLSADQFTRALSRRGWTRAGLAGAWVSIAPGFLVRAVYRGRRVCYRLWLARCCAEWRKLKFPKHYRKDKRR